MRFLFDEYSIDASSCALFRGNHEIKIERNVARLLIYLLRNRDRVVPKKELIEFLWDGTSISESSLPRCMSLLRSALGRREQNGPDIIETIYGQRYRFVSPIQIIHPPLQHDVLSGEIRVKRSERIEALKNELAGVQESRRREIERLLDLAELETRNGLIKSARSAPRRGNIASAGP